VAQLAVGIAVNVALGLALNALFPPPDIEQEGPRLRDLNFTGSAYGKFVNIMFGTDRVGGKIIDAQDPVIEEVVETESETVGKGGGQEVNTTTYTYFFTGRVAFATSGADTLLRLWGDGKLIFDATSNDQQLRSGANIRFLPGGGDQSVDTEEIGREDRDELNQPAYRHLSSIKMERLPLADFGNRIPNFTAEIGFSSTTRNDAIVGQGFPAGTSEPQLEDEHWIIDQSRDIVFASKRTAESFSIRNSNLQFVSTVPVAGPNTQQHMTTPLDGFAYGPNNSGNNASQLEKRDIQTGQLVSAIGTNSNGLAEIAGPSPRFVDVNRWDSLKTTVPGIGVFHTLFHTLEDFQNTPVTHLIDADNMSSITLLGVADGLFDTGTDWVGEMAPDHDRNTMVMLQQAAGGIVPIRIQVSAGFSGQGGASAQQGTPFFFNVGPQEVRGWAINRTNGDMILSNESELILFNPYDDIVLARRSGGAQGFKSIQNYFSRDSFGWLRGESAASAATSFIRVIDTRTLEDVYFVQDVPANVPSLGTSFNYRESAQIWDDTRNAIIARQSTRTVKIFVNRAGAEGISLSTVIDALCTEYQDIEMAGMGVGEFDSSELAGDSLLGYTINNRSTIRDVIQPLRDRFFFDVVQSDWQVKFPKRGSAPVVTIPEEFVGELRQPTDPNNPTVTETRIQDIELPMRLNVRYKNRDADYDPDIEHDKRLRAPVPTMASRLEKTLDIPIVDTPDNMKPVAQNWLWTLWNERRTLGATIPWRYLQLTPSDVVNIGIFGETSRLRMAEIDIGSTLFMGFTGVQEQSFQFQSNIPAGAGLGRPTNNIPSSLPTELLFLNAPLLSQADFNLGQFSNGYIAARGFDSQWPGASALRSNDSVQFQNVSSFDTQAAVGIVQSTPPAMEVIDGNPTNRFVEDSMTIRPLNRADAWESSTELSVLNGANTFAIIYPNGACAITQYQDAVLNADGTITLSRLLLGRLGTEDIAVNAPPVSSQVVLLSDSENNREIGPINKQSLLLTELNQSLSYRGVTVGTLLEDAETRMFTYTGRDLKPYSVSHVRGTFNGSNDLTIDWERRTRGPFSGELLDGSGIVPLNESIEQYEVTISSVIAGTSLTKVVDDATVVTFTETEINAEFTSLPTDLTARVVQVSETGLKSPSFEVSMV